MTVSLRESLELLFDGWTIPGTHTVAVASTELGCSVKVVSHDLVSMLSGPRDVALDQRVLRLQALEFVHIAEPLDDIV